MQKFKLMLFGGFRLVNADGELVMPHARKAKALLAWLAMNPDQQHLREKLAAVLWPDSDEVQGRHSLRQALGDLRKIMPGDAEPLCTTKDWILLDSKQIAIDVVEFERVLVQADTAALDQAIELYKGEFLEGCNPNSDSFDEWLSISRSRYSVLASNALEQRLTSLLVQADYERASYVAVRLLSINPLQETAYRALMQAHWQLGNPATALRWYRRCQSLLQRELGVAPDPQTQALHATLLTASDEAEANKLAKMPSGCACRAPLPTTVAHSFERYLYVMESAIEGVLDHIGGQGFLLRGENETQKAALLQRMQQLAMAYQFATCQHTLVASESAEGDAVLQQWVNGVAACLLNPPALLIVEHIHHANLETLKLLASLIAAAGGGALLLVMTSCFEGEPLDPLWRGAMRGAPLTTIDL